VQRFLEYFAVAPGGRTLIPAPLYHASPSQHAVLALAAGLDITLMPRFDAEEFLRRTTGRRHEGHGEPSGGDQQRTRAPWRAPRDDRPIAGVVLVRHDVLLVDVGW
ncbi:hypothetical protein ACFV0I_18425, partial [Microbacterium oxydans]